RHTTITSNPTAHPTLPPYLFPYTTLFRSRRIDRRGRDRFAPAQLFQVRLGRHADRLAERARKRRSLAAALLLPHSADERLRPQHDGTLGESAGEAADLGGHQIQLDRPGRVSRMRRAGWRPVRPLLWRRR